jgi:lipopolysaccharide export system permease protein
MGSQVSIPEKAYEMTLFRYIFKKAFIMWIGALISLAGMVFMANFIGNMSMFSENKTEGALVFTFMILSLPEMIYLVLPFSLCLGILAAQALFSRHVETIAMQSCSVSTGRIYLPYLILGVIAVGVMSLLSFYFYPVAQREADKIEKFKIDSEGIKGSFDVHGSRFRDGDDIYYVELLDIDGEAMERVSCYSLNGGRLSGILKADKAKWDGKAWILSGSMRLYFNDKGITTAQGENVLPLKKNPKDLFMARPNPEVLTIKELWHYFVQLKKDGLSSKSVETYFHNRISFVIAPLVMTILVLPFGMRFPRTGGIARGIALGLVFALSYWAFHSGMVSLGMSGYINPIAASWAANFAALAVGGIFINVKKGTYG